MYITEQNMNNDPDLISVVIPVYKVEKYLNECVQSVLLQTYENLQVILVDDGSPDRCGEMCDKWADKDHRIQVIHKKNGGLSDARNAGLAVAAGAYIAFVDSDDWIAPQMYEVMLKTIKEQNADIVACGIVNTYGDRQILYTPPYCIGSSEKFLRMIYEDTVFSVSAWNKLYRKSCWSNFQFPKGKLCEDAFTTFLLVDNANKIVQISEAFYYYRIRENSIMTSGFRHARMDEEEAWRCNYEYMRAHYPSIAKKAFDFYLQKVNMLIHTISREQRESFKQDYQKLYGILKENLSYILFRSNSSYKYRIKFLIDFIKLGSSEKKK